MGEAEPGSALTAGVMQCVSGGGRGGGGGTAVRVGSVGASESKKKARLKGGGPWGPSLYRRLAMAL